MNGTSTTATKPQPQLRSVRCGTRDDESSSHSIRRSRSLSVSARLRHYARVGALLSDARANGDTRLADIEVIVNGHRDRVHSIVASVHSVHIRDLLRTHSLPLAICLDGYSAKAVVRVFDWMYSGEIDVSLRNLAQLLAVTARLGVLRLHDELEQRLAQLANHLEERVQCVNISNDERLQVSPWTRDALISQFAFEQNLIGDYDIQCLSLQSICALLRFPADSLQMKVDSINLAISWLLYPNRGIHIGRIMDSIRVSNVSQSHFDLFIANLQHRLMTANSPTSLSSLFVTTEDGDHLTIRMDQREGEYRRRNSPLLMVDDRDLLQNGGGNVSASAIAFHQRDNLLKDPMLRFNGTEHGINGIGPKVIHYLKNERHSRHHQHGSPLLRQAFNRSTGLFEREQLNNFSSPQCFRRAAMVNAGDNRDHLVFQEKEFDWNGNLNNTSPPSSHHHLQQGYDNNRNNNPVKTDVLSKMYNDLNSLSSSLDIDEELRRKTKMPSTNCLSEKKNPTKNRHISRHAKANGHLSRSDTTATKNYVDINRNILNGNEHQHGNRQNELQNPVSEPCLFPKMTPSRKLPPVPKTKNFAESQTNNARQRMDEYMSLANNFSANTTTTTTTTTVNERAPTPTVRSRDATPARQNVQNRRLPDVVSTNSATALFIPGMEGYKKASIVDYWRRISVKRPDASPRSESSSHRPRSSSASKRKPES